MKALLAELFIPFDAQHRPELGTLALVLGQGVNKAGDYRFGYDVAIYTKYWGDRRKRVWGVAMQILQKDQCFWVYTNITHYLPLDGGLYDDVLPHESLLPPGLKEWQLGDANVSSLERCNEALDK